MAGCTSGASNAPAPDKAALAVTVKAEPKTGWRDRSGQTSAYEPAQMGLGPQYRTVDYSGLDEIVVWVEPTVVPATPPVILAIDIAAPPLGQQLAGRGAVWRLSNTGREPQPAFIRAEDGAVQNIGVVRPGTIIDVSPGFTGPVELLLDSRDEPLAHVFIAPSPLARLAAARRKVTFDNLPPGPATVSCWHARLPGSSQTVDLAAGKTARVELRVTVNQLPKVP